MRPIVCAILLASISTSQAEPYGCGYYQCKLAGISRAECRKRGLSLALNWSREFQHVSAPAPSVVVVQARRGRALGGGAGGHVSKIVEITDHCRAIVVDNRGRYERNICKNLVAYVQPSDGNFFAAIHKP